MDNRLREFASNQRLELIAVVIHPLGLVLTMQMGRAHWHSRDSLGPWWRVSVARA